MTRDPEDDEPPPEEIVLALEDHLDLHAFAPRDVGSVTEAYLDQAAEAGLRDVRIIHGRGIGAQREIVRAVLARHPAVISFRDAPPERGAWGATLARLRTLCGFDRPERLPDNGAEDEHDGRPD